MTAGTLSQPTGNIQTLKVGTQNFTSSIRHDNILHVSHFIKFFFQVFPFLTQRENRNHRRKYLEFLNIFTNILPPILNLFSNATCDFDFQINISRVQY